jgi:hypothetical protein
MRSVSRLSRVAACGVASVGDVGVYVRDGQAGYGGVITCGSVWACAPCSARVRQRRAADVEAHAKRWLGDGHGLLFVTLTRSHSMADDLADLLDGELQAWRAVQQHWRFREAGKAVGYVGALRATEVTHGYNGWHPHLHLLLWLERPLETEAASCLEESIAGVWLGLVDGSRQHAVKAVRVGVQLRDAQALAAYLVKVQDGYDKGRWSAAHEMVRGDLKRGRSKHRNPFQIAEAAAFTGDKKAAALWHHYEAATKGRRCMEWGRKLRERLGAVDGETVEGVEVMRLSVAEWNLLRGYNSEARLLDAVERAGLLGGVQVIRSCMRRARFDHARGRPPRAPNPAAAIIRQRVDRREQVA